LAAGAAATVAGGDIEVAIGPESNPPDVMWCTGLFEREQDQLTADIARVGIRLADAEAGENGVAVQIRVGDKEVPVALVLRVKGDRGQRTLRVLGVNQRRDVKEGIGEDLAVLDDANEPDPLREEESLSVLGGLGERRRCAHDGDRLRSHEIEGAPGGGFRPRQQHRGHGCDQDRMPE